MAANEDQNLMETNTASDEAELEQYGVWVKAGPEDVDESEAEDEGFALADLDEATLEAAESEVLADSSSEEIELEEIDLDIDLGDDEPQQTESEISELQDTDLDILDLDPEDDDADELDAPVLGTDELTIPDSAEETVSLGEMESLDDDLSLEDLDSDVLSLEDDDIPTSSDDISLDIDDLEDLEDLDDAPASLVPESGSEDLELDLDSELDLEQSSELVSQPDEVGSGGILDDSLTMADDLPDDLDDLTLDLDSLDVDAFQEPQEGEPQSPSPIEVEEQVFVLGDDDDIATLEETENEPATQTEPALEDLDLASLADEDDPFDSLTADGEQPSDGDIPELAVEDDILDLEDGFDDLSAVEDEMSDVFASDHTTMELDIPDDVDLDLDFLAAESAQTAETQPPVADQLGLAAAAATGTTSQSLGSDVRLESIERELAAIREEIREEIRSEIRNELGDLKREIAQLRVHPGASGLTDGGMEDDAAGGFFPEEDDDETIQLTEDELDNIMNTAEFTEEKGEPTEVDEIDQLTEDFLKPGPEVTTDISLDDLDLAEDTPVLQEITLDDTTEDLDPIELDLDASGIDGIDLSLTEDPDISVAVPDDQFSALNDIDIDQELDGIEELEDTTESGTAHMQSQVTVEPQDTLVMDVEPLDLEETDVESTTVDTREPGPVPLADHDETAVPDGLKSDLRDVLEYMDQLLESLPEDKIREFAQSDHFKVYQRLFDELGLEQ